MLTLFHVTTAENAANILHGGFIDGRSKYMTETELRGVFLSDDPHSEFGTGVDEAILMVTFNLAPSELADFELIEEGKPYREWCVPAAIIRSHASVAFA